MGPAIRPTFYTWLNRYEEHGEDGLRDRSSRPHHEPVEIGGEDHGVDAVAQSKLRQDALDVGS